MSSDTEAARPTPKAFISYSWDDERHKLWVRDFGTRLRGDGVNVTLDQWHLQPGDQMTAFMERAIRENDYVLPICTPLYAQRSNQRIGGAGYEGGIMTAEVFTTRNERKCIPIFRSGADWNSAAPTWLLGKYRIDLRGAPYSEREYQDLLTTLHGMRPVAPPVVPRHRSPPANPLPATPPTPKAFSFEPVRILGVVVDEVTYPRNDGTAGSALYRVPLQLSRRPSSEWVQVFIHSWNHPSTFTTLHRPGIASVSGDRTFLSGTTIEEIANTHRATLVLAVNAANQAIEAFEREKFDRDQDQRRQIEEHERRVRETAAGLKFDT